MASTSIQLIKINEAFFKVKAEEFVHKGLADHFTFVAPNYKFHPKYKARLWDGKIRLYNLSTKILYSGLLSKLKQYCVERGYDLQYSEDDFPEYKFTPEQADIFAKKANIKLDDMPAEVRDYQIAYFHRAIRKRKTLLLCPTGGGKSLIAYLISLYLLGNEHKKGIILVPRVQLVSQLVNDWKEYGFDCDQFVHSITAGDVKHTNKPITITTWQSVFKLSPEYFAQFDFVIGDEAHLFTANSLKKVMTAAINAKARIGMSGSLDGTKTHQLMLEGIFGEVYQAVKTKQLIDQGYLAKLNVKCLVLEHNDEIKKYFRTQKVEYRDEMGFLISHEKRTNFISKLAMSLKGNTMIFYQMVDKHGSLIFESLKRLNTNRNIYFIHGGVKAEERERIRSLVETDTNAIIVASYGTLSTGSNFKNLHNIIFASNFKARITNMQTIGRGLRIGSTKNECTLYDIADDISSVTEKRRYENHTLRHFKARLQIYTDEEHDFKIYNIKL